MHKDELKDGNYLKQLLKELDFKPSQENYYKVINCLRDSILWEKVPVLPESPEIYYIYNSKGEKIPALDSMYYEMMITSEQKKYLVFYSQYSKGIDEDGQAYTMHDLPMLNRIIELIGNQEYNGFVIDPQENNILFDLEDCKRILRAPGVIENKTEDVIDYLQKSLGKESYSEIYDQYLNVLHQFTRMGMEKAYEAVQQLEKYNYT